MKIFWVFEHIATEMNILECNAKLISVVISLKETLAPHYSSNTVSHAL